MSSSGPRLPAPGRPTWRSEELRRNLEPAADDLCGPFSFRDRICCLGRREMLVLLPIYLLGLIPFAGLLAWLGRRLDRAAGLPPLLEPPGSLVAGGMLMVGGALVVAWSYSYLILEGGGGPVPPFSARTRRLVTTGPYALVRHPSIWGKLAGVVGLGLAFGSWTFTFGMVPLLLGWSLLWNRFRQERDLARCFGERYLTYRRRTPMLIPRPEALFRALWPGRREEAP